ncbi:MAG: 50S ribosomal protein L24 [Candidatus Binatia bacterium]
MHIRKNDSVMVIAGRERGKTGKVLRILPEKGLALIERVNLVKRHSRARGAQQSGGILEKEAFLQASNLMVMCDKCNGPVRVGKKVLADEEKVRICRRCGGPLD